jgi:carboxypeptidase C (cathepsin A)
MMLRRVAPVFFAFILLASLLASGQQRDRQGQQSGAMPSPTPAAAGEAGARTAAEPKKEVKEAPEAPPVVTHHEIHVGGKTLRYTATAGMMPLKNVDTGEVEAHIFYIAYTLDGQSPERPVH